MWRALLATRRVGHARCKGRRITSELEDGIPMKLTIFTPAVALLGTTLLIGSAHAQMNDGEMNKPGTMKMDKPMMPTSDADKQYLMESAQGSAYDGATAALGVQKAQSKSVQRYAQRLMDDHTRLNKMMFIQANTRGLTLPLTLADEDKTKLQELMSKEGSDFDVAYLQEAIKINAEDIKTGNEAINASSDAEFRRLLRDFVNTEQKHLDQASALLAGLQREMGLMNGNGMMMPKS